MMPYLAAVFGFSSTLSLTILTLSPTWPEISSSAGAIMRHGPHHSAQKSTTTGSADFNTSASKLASDVLPTAMALSSCYGRQYCVAELQDGIASRRTYDRAPSASTQSIAGVIPDNVAFSNSVENPMI